MLKHTPSWVLLESLPRHQFLNSPESPFGRGINKHCGGRNAAILPPIMAAKPFFSPKPTQSDPCVRIPFAKSFGSYRAINSGLSTGSLAIGSSKPVDQGIGHYFTTVQFQTMRCQFPPDSQVSPMVMENTSRVQVVEASFQLPKRRTPHWQGNSTWTAIDRESLDALSQRFPQERRAIDRWAAAW